MSEQLDLEAMRGFLQKDAERRGAHLASLAIAHATRLIDEVERLRAGLVKIEEELRSGDDVPSVRCARVHDQVKLLLD